MTDTALSVPEIGLMLVEPQVGHLGMLDWAVLRNDKVEGEFFISNHIINYSFTIRQTKTCFNSYRFNCFYIPIV